MKRAKRRVKRLRHKFPWHGPLEGWVHNYATKHVWRVEGLCERDDLINEGYVVYAKCLRRYGNRVKTQRHFMSLFQSAYARHIVDLSKRRTKNVEELVDTDIEQVSMFQDDILELAELLEGMPEELKNVVNVFVKSQDELWKVLSDLWNKSGNVRRHKKASTQRLASILGMDGRDLRDEIRKLLMKN